MSKLEKALESSDPTCYTASTSTTYVGIALYFSLMPDPYLTSLSSVPISFQLWVVNTCTTLKSIWKFKNDEILGDAVNVIHLGSDHLF